MKELIINDKKIEFFIDYLRVPRKANHNYSNNEFDYNCDLSIVSKQELSEYEREIVARFIRNAINNYDVKEDMKKIIGGNK